MPCAACLFTATHTACCPGGGAALEQGAELGALPAAVASPAQENPIEEVAGIDVVANVKQQHEITAGISNSFGFGGHNSVVVFAPFKA